MGNDGQEIDMRISTKSMHCKALLSRELAFNSQHFF